MHETKGLIAVAGKVGKASVARRPTRGIMQQARQRNHLLRIDSCSAGAIIAALHKRGNCGKPNRSFEIT
ncbi:hypothetical protein GCM10027343_27140 [Noviherbaspirillum agri]